MEPDRLDEIGAALFKAARSERPRSAAKQRALHAVSDAPRRASRRRVAVSVVVLCGAVAAGVLLFRGLPERDPALLQPEAEHLTPSRTPSPQKSSQEGVPALPPPAPSSSATMPSARPSAAPATPSLSDEIRNLDRARTRLGANDPAGALQLLDEYDRRGRRGRLADEATLLRIEALARAGRKGDAEGLAKRFVRANPDSSLSDRARGFIADSGADEDREGVRGGKP